MVGKRKPIPPASRAGAVLRYACLLTALGNLGGNLLFLPFHRLILTAVGAPVPEDIYFLSTVCGFSAASGVLAFIVFLQPERAEGLLAAGIASKGSFAWITLVFYASGTLHWFWMLIGAWDMLYVVIFWLYLIHLTRQRLMILNAGVIDVPDRGRGLEPPRSKQALLIYYSLTNNGTLAMKNVRAGLEAGGYTCTEVALQPQDRALYRFPFTSLWQFLRILIGAMVRRPAAVVPVEIPPDHDYDLIVCETQTWMVGISAPVEGFFLRPAHQAILEGREVALVNVSRGQWRRAQAQAAAWIERSGGYLIGTSAHGNPGREPARTFSLFLFLALGQPGRPAWLKSLLTTQHIGDLDQAELYAFGHRLAHRYEDNESGGPGGGLDAGAVPAAPAGPNAPTGLQPSAAEGP